MSRGVFRVLDLKHSTIVDGVGLRTAIYFAGCKHHCSGCHNPQSWDMMGGKVMTQEQLCECIRQEKSRNVTLTGGDPLFQDLESLESLIKAMRKEGVQSVWLYTGYTFEFLLQHEAYAAVLSVVDVIVDGPYMEQLRSTQVPFRGSTNQRIIDVKKSIINNIIIEYEH